MTYVSSGQPVCVQWRKIGLVVQGVVVALVLAGFHPNSTADTLQLAPPLVLSDLRVEKLETFFQSYGCPEPHHVQDYLLAADAYGLDYRLLPALSVRESTCGWHARWNNFWGWDSAQTGFESVTRGIDFVSRRLAFGRYYCGKTVDEKLRTYNQSNPAYADEVRKLMQEIEGDGGTSWNTSDAAGQP